MGKDSYLSLWWIKIWMHYIKNFPKGTGAIVQSLKCLLCKLKEQVWYPVPRLNNQPISQSVKQLVVSVYNSSVSVLERQKHGDPWSAHAI